MSDIGRILVIAGVALAVVGGVILLLDRFSGLPIGRLPGDFSWERGNTRIYFPLATMIIASIVLTILINIVMRFFR